jgi:hypothetical protein
MTGHVTPIKIFGEGTISSFSSSVANIDVPEDGEILAIMGFVSGKGMDGDGDAIYAELSFLSSHQIETNDARGSILEVAHRVVVGAAGAMQSSENVSIGFSPGSGIPVNGGERIHLHTFGSTGVTPKGSFLIYLSAGGARRATRRR